MKATGRFFTCSFSLLLFFSWSAGNQRGNAARARVRGDLEASEFAWTRADGIKQAKPPARKAAGTSGWLEGVWEGTAYQSNTRENWTLRLTATNQTYRVDYPTLSCGGEWKLLRMDKRTARFREKLNYGQGKCVDNVTVIIQRLNRRQVAYWYVEQHQTRVDGIAVLDRQ
jgi:hypothetical protein